MLKEEVLDLSNYFCALQGGSTTFCGKKIRTYNPNKGNIQVGFRPRLNGHHTATIIVGWVEG